MPFVNLTPHALRLITSAGEVIEISPEATPARVSSTAVELPAVNGVAAQRNEWGAVTGLPAPQEGVTYLVSLLILDHIQGRSDVAAPATGPRDGCIRGGDPDCPDPTLGKGMVWAVRRLVFP